MPVLPPLQRRDAWWACWLAGALILWHLPAFTLIPAVSHDEITLNAAARSWTARGAVALSPLAGNGLTYATAYYWHPPGYLLLVAGAYEALGFSIEVTRGVSLASGAVAVALLFLVLRHLSLSRPMAAAATALFASHPLVWWLCRSGRMDLTAIGFGLAAMLVTLGHAEEKSSARRAGLAGILIGLGGLVHVMVLVWAPALIAADALRNGRIAWKNAIVLGAMAALPVLTWVAVVFAIGDGPAWMEQFVGYQLGQRHATGPLWLRPLDELTLFARQFRLESLMIPVLAVGMVTGWRERSRARWWAAGGAIAAFCLIAVFTSKGTGAYPLYWFVWALLAAAPGMASLRSRTRAWLLGLAIANAAAVQLGFAAIALYQREARDPARVDRFFAEHVRAGSIVAGPEDAWYAVEHAGAQLRIWEKPDPYTQDYYVTYANIPSAPPAGFQLLAELPDTMPKVLGRYWSSTACSYRLWVPRR